MQGLATQLVLLTDMCDVSILSLPPAAASLSTQLSANVVNVKQAHWLFGVDVACLGFYGVADAHPESP